jgi:hypothetical protein
MGCGCKNKTNQITTEQKTVQQSASQQVQDAIKRTVEKYYENKK